MEKKENIPIKNGELKEKHLVTQSNEVVEAMYQISLTAKKLMVSIISQIEPKDEDFKYYMIPVSDWKKLAGINSKANYFKILIGAAEELRSKSITIDMNDETKVNLGLVSAVKEDKKRKLVGVRFDAELKPYLLSLRRNFTSYTLDKVMKLRSVYSIRLYEILKSKRDKGQTKWMTALDILKLKLGVTGKAYSNFHNFKVKIIEVAGRELLKKTDIRFNYTPFKEGRKVSDIEFTIYTIPKYGEVNELLPKLLNMIPKEWIKESEGICKKILKEKGPDCLDWLIQYTNKQKYDNYAAYITVVYKSDAYETYLKQKELEKQIQKEAAAEAAEREKKQKEKERAQKELVDHETILTEFIENLPPEELEVLNERALALCESEAVESGGANLTLKNYNKYIHAKKPDRALVSIYRYRLRIAEELLAEKESYVLQ